MSWIDNVPLDRTKLLPGASAAEIEAVESALSVKFPAEFREFLSFADGGRISNLVLFSAGRGLHPSERLIPANIDLPAEFPAILIGSDATYPFGYLKRDINAPKAPIYFLFEETWQVDCVASSLEEFLKKITALPKGEGLRGGKWQDG